MVGPSQSRIVAQIGFRFCLHLGQPHWLAPLCHLHQNCTSRIWSSQQLENRIQQKSAFFLWLSFSWGTFTFLNAPYLSCEAYLNSCDYFKRWMWESLVICDLMLQADGGHASEILKSYLASVNALLMSMASNRVTSWTLNSLALNCCPLGFCVGLERGKSSSEQHFATSVEHVSIDFCSKMSPVVKYWKPIFFATPFRKAKINHLWSFFI